MRLRRGEAPRRDLRSYADGRVWRLKRGRDFDDAVPVFRRSLASRAEAMGKVVRSVPDKLEPHRYVWVQFGEARVAAGDPCVCGSAAVERVHVHWGRCSACGALLELVESASANGVAGEAALVAGPRTPLDAYTQVRLYRHDVDERRERCFGLAKRADGAEVVLVVMFPLWEGVRVPHPKVPGHWYYYAHAVPPEMLEPLVDLADIDGGVPVGWRIDEDPGPRPSLDAELPPG